MVPAAHDRPPKPAGEIDVRRFRPRSGIVASILTTALVLVFFSGGIEATFGLAWVWTIAVGLWIYVLFLI